MQRIFLALLLFVAAEQGVVARAADGRSGAEIYKQLCASCHGLSGEGVKAHYAKPLVGDKSIVELAELIAKTMPEGDPEKCVGPDAARVAAYIYETFYSPIAQARNQPAKLELSRLTVRQYRQSVADLVGSFRWTNKWDDKRGLKGEYFKKRTSQKELERLDPTVDFDFGEVSPLVGKIEPVEFGMRWSGSLLAPESGDFEFILETQNGARLWVNDMQTPLIDGSVRSGKDVALRESVRLLGGRAYPIRLEFFKSKEAKEKTARIVLKWKQPHREPEVVPARCLSPVAFPELFISTVPFPPDDRSVGYERGTAVSEAWEQAVMDSAIEVSAYVYAKISELAGTKPDAKDRNEKLREFARKFAERAFRRPLTDDLKKLYLERPFAETPDPELAVKRCVLLVLMSPRFLYHEVDHGKPDSFDVAARLSFGLWDSLPDQGLMQAAAQGKLSTPAEVRKQAERMLDDPRTRGKLHDFFVQWLRVDHFEELSKDTKRFPDFDDALVSDLHTALDLFLDDVIWSESSDFRQLLLADSLYLNGKLSKFYGGSLPADAPFQKVSLPKGPRAGVLTHPYLMAGYAYNATSSPIHRGVFIARSVLGRALRPPPEAVAPLAADLHAELTTRQRVDLQTKAESCQACHRMINPLGFAFENFDAVGRFRAEEKGKPIDATGVYQTRTGEKVKFSDVRELAAFLARSDETHEAFVEQLFHYLVKQPILAYGPQTHIELERSFAAQGFHIRKLMIEMLVASAFGSRDGSMAQNDLPAKSQAAPTAPVKGQPVTVKK
ncbi:MAG: DUF1592 domain-containing protein [Planctomycetia bacterium]|nr:DUF1592 domain-containing protein [Planctomycetia bacterium]